MVKRKEINRKISKGKEKLSNRKNFCFLAFFIMFMIGALNLKSTGVYNDEKIEQRILRMNIREYVEFISPYNDLVEYYKEKGVGRISQDLDRDHGVAPYLIFAPLLALENVSGQLLSFLWHFYTYILFFTGIILIYLISQKITKNHLISFLSSALAFFSPRMFADGLYNNKDIVLMSFVLAIIYFGINFIQKKDKKSAILLGICAAFATNIKITGFFIFGMIGLFYLIEVIRKKEWSKQKFFIGLLAIISMLIPYILITPAIWGNKKFDLIPYFTWCLTEGTKYSRWNGKVLFEGRVYDYEKNMMLPWYYLPKMMIITLPIITMILFIIGTFYLIKNTIKEKKKIKEQTYFMWMIFLCFLLPLLIGILGKVKLYNGWRHCYFLYGPLMILTMYGLDNVYGQIKRKKALIIILCLILSYNLYFCISSGINNTAYYNVLVNQKNIREKYELDYYGVSTKKLLKKALQKKKQNTIYIYSENYSIAILSNNRGSLSKLDQQEVIILDHKKDYNQLKKEGKEVYIFYNHVYNDKKLIKNHKIKYREKEKGQDIIALYE